MVTYGPMAFCGIWILAKFRGNQNFAIWEEFHKNEIPQQGILQNTGLTLSTNPDCLQISQTTRSPN